MVNMEEGSNESRKFHQMIATVLQETRAFMEAAPAVPPWLAYLAMDNRLGGLVGNCNFKGNPSEEGEVEIGIVTFDSRRWRRQVSSRNSVLRAKIRALRRTYC